MKIKLIQSGGFIGRTKTAELDLNNVPDLVVNQLINFINNNSEKISSSQERDNFINRLIIEDKGNLKQVLVKRKDLPESLQKLYDELESKLSFKL